MIVRGSCRHKVDVFLFVGSVENVQIYPRFQNFDIKRSKASLPVIGTFKRSLHDLKSQESGSVPIRLSNKNVSQMKWVANFATHLLPGAKGLQDSLAKGLQASLLAKGLQASLAKGLQASIAKSTWQLTASACI